MIYEGADVLIIKYELMEEKYIVVCVGVDEILTPIQQTSRGPHKIIYQK